MIRELEKYLGVEIYGKFRQKMLLCAFWKYGSGHQNHTLRVVNKYNWIVSAFNQVILREFTDYFDKAGNINENYSRELTT